MSVLSEILDDIQGDAIKPEGMVESTPGKAVATEVGYSLKPLRDRANKHAQMITVSRVFQDAMSKPVLDKATALELFTMLPISANSAAMLTQQPTEHNKRVLASVAPGNINPQESTELVLSVIAELDVRLTNYEQACQVYQTYTDALSANLTRLQTNKPIVIWEGTAIDLLNASIGMVARINSFSLEYEPYQGKLDAMFMAIDNDDEFKSIVAGGYLIDDQHSSGSLAGIAGYLQAVARTCLGSLQKLKGHQASLSNYLQTPTTEDYPHFAVDNCFDGLEQLKASERLFSGKDCLADKVVACLNFLV